MIIQRSEDWIQVFIALLKDCNQQGIQSFGNSTLINEYLRAHPDQVFYLEPLINGGLLSATNQKNHGTTAGDVFTGTVRFDSQQNQIICD